MKLVIILSETKSKKTRGDSTPRWGTPVDTSLEYTNSSTNTWPFFSKTKEGGLNDCFLYCVPKSKRNDFKSR